MMDGRLLRLDHLRFMACFAVMSWHFTHAYVPVSATPKFALLSVIEEGHTGVSFFCVISGFIFAWLYNHRPMNYFAFQRRRAFRIFPLFILMIMLTVVVVGNWRAEHVLRALTTIHYGALPGYVAPGWSVLVEMQFYFVFPFLLLFTKRYGTVYLVGLLVLFLLLRGMVWVDKGTIQGLSYWTIFGRADQFIVGIVAGLTCRRLAEREDRTVQTAALACGLLGFAAITFPYAKLAHAGGFDFDPKSPFWIVLPTIEAISYGLIVSGYLLFAGGVNFLAGPISRFIGYLGRISYSMYLMHVLVFMVVHRTLATSASSWEQAMVLFVLAGLPPVILVSSLTYTLVERPFLALERSETVPLTMRRWIDAILARMPARSLFLDAPPETRAPTSEAATGYGSSPER